jgi:hypothetical protein
MARKRGSKPNMDMTSFMDIITATVGNVLLILLLMILCATENPAKDIIIKVKEIEQTSKEKMVKYVETTREGITLHPIGQKVSMDNMEKPNSGFMEFLRMIDRDNEYIIFAIRPDGYKSFQKARDLAEKNQIEVGYEPIDKLWNLEIEDAKT